MCDTATIFAIHIDLTGQEIRRSTTEMVSSAPSHWGTQLGTIWLARGWLRWLISGNSWRYLRSHLKRAGWVKGIVKVGAWCWQQSHHHRSLAVADFSVFTCAGGFESSPYSHVLGWMLLTGRAETTCSWLGCKGGWESIYFFYSTNFYWTLAMS